MNKRSNQGGSVASFIIIGVILVIMTTGILYWVRHKDTPIARESPTPEVTMPGNDVVTNDDKPTEATKPREEEKSTPPAAESAPSSPASAPQPDVTTLSQTGPADTALQLLAIGALAVVGVSFIRSRNHATSL